VVAIKPRILVQTLVADLQSRKWREAVPIAVETAAADAAVVGVEKMTSTVEDLVVVVQRRVPVEALVATDLLE
jgi:hypothetical protein